jgi:hypothetical protein
MFANKVVDGPQGWVKALGILKLQHETNQLNLWFSIIMIWIVIGFGLDCQSHIPCGFGLD